jgi:TrmH family RNA methyltransferase
MLTNTVITSRQHPICKLVRSLHNSRDRRKHGLFVVEGGNGVTAALRARWPLQRLLAAPEDLEAGWGDIAAKAGVEAVALEPELLEYVSEAQTSPGVIALASLPEARTLGQVAAEGLALALDGIGDPGNVGTLIRSADAAGAGSVLAFANSADAFAPKAVRSSAGSVFHLPPVAVSSPTAFVDECAEANLPIVVAVAHNGVNCFEYAWPGRCVLVLGHETRGISEEVEAAATARVTIPMRGRAESLNVAAAGAVLLFAWQQRN